MSLLGFFLHLRAQKQDYSQYPVYTGDDLGLSWSPEKSRFRIWAPTASAAELRLYTDGQTGDPVAVFPMEKKEQGTWLVTVPGNSSARFYSFRVKINGQWSKEVTDPYVKAVAVNGGRGAIINPALTNPPDWEKDRGPALQHKTDAVIYELHVRDAGIHESAGFSNKGKFKGLTETGTRNKDGLSTGLDHIAELGVTHVHLLPVFDFHSIDETRPDARYNWGYDPLNYNVPEGSYATDPYNPVIRIREFKEMVQAFHRKNIGVIMDVVYNHTALTETSNFNQLVPGYYYRQTADGKFSNATACGNETASERPMFRKFMLESMLYWVKEYHVDGFRIDLMGVHDIATMNLISAELHRVRPGILLYGEGWTAGASPLPDSLRALKSNAARLDRIAVFSDDIRDGIKGSVFIHDEPGFASGKAGMEESIKFGIVASCPHPQVVYEKVNYSKAPWAAGPEGAITYCECHDNHVLWDKLALSARDKSEEERKEMHRLALTLVLSSQGIPFLHAGTEFFRSKKGVENSYDSPDSINAIDWRLKSRELDFVNYVKALLDMRKQHPAFRLTDPKAISRLIRFTDDLPAGGIAYTIRGEEAGDSWKQLFLYFNGTGKPMPLSIPANRKVFILNNKLKTEGSDGNLNAGTLLQLSPYSSTLLYLD